MKAEMRMTVDVQCKLPKLLEFKIAVIFGKSQLFWLFIFSYKTGMTRIVRIMRALCCSLL
jgi:hypothetical protein